jgi:hypothetical protein
MTGNATRLHTSIQVVSGIKALYQLSDVQRFPDTACGSGSASHDEKLTDEVDWPSHGFCEVSQDPDVDLAGLRWEKRGLSGPRMPSHWQVAYTCSETSQHVMLNWAYLM